MGVDIGNVYQQAMDRFQLGRDSAGRDLVPFREPLPPALPSAVGKELSKTSEGDKRGTSKDVYIPIIDVRNASPREISQLGQDFYAAGIFQWREYEMLAFQPELQPGFNNTIGALTGEKADPGRPRDYIDIWEDRLRFEKKYNPDDKELIGRTQHIVSALRHIESPTNLVI